MKSVDIIVLNYNTASLTIDCINSVLSIPDKVNYRIIVVDNGSSDGSYEKLYKLFHQNKKIILIKSDENLGFSGGNNLGIKLFKADYLLLLNSDTIVPEGTIGGMINWMENRKDLGIATCALKNKDGSLQGTGGYFPNILNVATWMTIEDLPFVSSVVRPFHPMRKIGIKNTSFYKKQTQLDWVTGAFLLVKKEVVDEIGFLDDDYFMYTEDVDYCYRAKRKGWKISYNPDLSITHFGGSSSTSEFAILSEFSGIKRFFKKHYPAWQYPLLVFFLKIGALWRAFIFGILEGKGAFGIYVKAFKQA